MAQYIIKRTIFLTPKARVAGVKSLAPLPNRVVLKKAEQFEGTLKPSTDPNVDSILAFEYKGYVFEKPYGGIDMYARMNKEDLALVGTPEAFILNPPQKNTMPIVKPPKTIASSKSTSAPSMFKFKDKLHAGVTLVGVAFGVYYAYKTKGSVAKYLGYALGGGAVGFILGSVASSFAMQTSVKQKKEEGNVPDLAKPAFDGVYADGMSIERDAMVQEMNSIL